jgi:hypothetical protein
MWKASRFVGSKALRPEMAAPADITEDVYRGPVYSKLLLDEDPSRVKQGKRVKNCGNARFETQVRIGAKHINGASRTEIAMWRRGLEVLKRKLAETIWPYSDLIICISPFAVYELEENYGLAREIRCAL